MDLDELLDGLDGEDVEDLFNRLRKRARASAPIMKKVAEKLLIGSLAITGPYGVGAMMPGIAMAAGAALRKKLSPVEKRLEPLPLKPGLRKETIGHDLRRIP